MWWYVAISILFSLYVFDLLLHFGAALVATIYWHFCPQLTERAVREARKAGKIPKHRTPLPPPRQPVVLPVKDAQANNDIESGIIVDARGDVPSLKPIRTQMGVPAPGVVSTLPPPEDLTHLSSLYNGEFPKVVVQLPMYNEEACCETIIEACCSIQWPAHRKLVQVCDDSTNDRVVTKIQDCCRRMREQGHNVALVRRDNRSGYKAGAMVEGLERIKDQGFEFVAIFDADFQPPQEFLYQTVIYMARDPRVGFVQCRWTFRAVNSLLTWAQKVNLSFHFAVEQRSRAFMGWFFNFNGTAGCWRIATVHDAGGWESDTVVEDMDLSLRAYLRGWTTIYLHDVHCVNELPSSMSAYKTQQFRWLSGPMQIVRKSFGNIWRSDIGLLYKLNAYWFFLRYTLFVGVTLVALVAPIIILWLDEWTWTWPCIWFLVSANLATVLFLYFTIFSVVYMIFAIVTGYFKLWAMLSGLLGLKKSKTWKVTLKTANNSNFLLRLYHAPYLIELVLFVYYCVMTGFCVWYAIWALAAYTAIMAVAFILCAFGDYLL